MLIATAIFYSILIFLAKILGKYISIVFAEKNNIFNSISILILNKLKINSTPQTWHRYFFSTMIFSLILFIFIILVLINQQILPLNPNNIKNLSFDAAFNAACSFVTNSFWQSHLPEHELSVFSMIMTITFMNFMAPAIGLTSFVAFIKGVKNQRDPLIGNFFQDFLKALLFILLPLAFGLALFLISQSVPQQFLGVINYNNIFNIQQELPLLPIAAQTAIKIIASNGGSILNSATSHPFEASTQLAIIMQLMCALLLPFSMIFAFGKMLNDEKQTWMLIFVVMFFLLSSQLMIFYGETIYDSDDYNFIWSGKDLLIGRIGSIYGAAITTMSSTGTFNLDVASLTPISILACFINIIVGKFILDSVGTGFFSMLIYLIIAVFIKGLITGKNAVFLNKKITSKEINYVLIALLVFPAGVLIMTNISLNYWFPDKIIESRNISEIAFAYASSFANNGAAINSLDISSPYYNYTTGIAMLIGRYLNLFLALSIAGSFAKKADINNNIIQSNNLDFAIFLIILILLIVIISFFPVILLGPVLELLTN